MKKVTYSEIEKIQNSADGSDVQSSSGFEYNGNGFTQTWFFKSWKADYHFDKAQNHVHTDYYDTRENGIRWYVIIAIIAISLFILFS